MSDLNLTSSEQRIVDYHNQSISLGRIGVDQNGNPMTVYSIGIRIPKGENAGKFVSVPGYVPEVNPDQPLTEEQAYRHWEKQIQQGLWPIYESGEALNKRSEEIHRIMDMDGDILKQNMESDGKQSIHVTPKEARIVEEVEGSAPRRREFQRDWKFADVRGLVSTARNSSPPNMMFASPTSTSGLAYVDKDMSPTTDMRGNKTPMHLQRIHDDIRSYQTSEMARNVIESYRASLPRNVQDSLNGSVFVEQGNDGIYTTILGNQKTGYNELSYGSDDQSYFDALSDVKKSFFHMYNTGDADLDAGFLGRAASAEQFGSRSENEIQDEMRYHYDRANFYLPIDQEVAVNHIKQADEMGDEIKRRRRAPETKTFPYSLRVLLRDVMKRADEYYSMPNLMN